MPRRSYTSTAEQYATLPIDDGLGEGGGAGLLIPLDDGAQPADYDTGGSFEPPGGRMKFPPLHPPDASEPKPAAKEEDEDLFEVDPVSGAPRLVHVGKNTVGADIAALPRDKKGRLIPGETKPIPALPEPAAAASDFPPLRPPDTAPAADVPAMPAQKIVQWSEISAHPSFGDLDTENKLTVLDKWAEFVRGKIDEVDDPDTAKAALDKYVSAQGAVISPTYATAKELRTKMQEENRAGGFDFFLGPLPDDQVARLAAPMNGSQLSLARTGIPDTWGELNEKRKAETAFFEVRKDLVKEAGDEELADLIIERERERRRVDAALPMLKKKADDLYEQAGQATDPEERKRLQQEYSDARSEQDALRASDWKEEDGGRIIRPGKLGQLDEQIRERADKIAHADNGIARNDSARNSFFLTWSKNSTNFLEHNFIGKAMTKATDLMMQLAGAPAGSAQGAASDLGATMDEVLAGRIPEGMSKALVNPALRNSTQEQIARGVGSLMDPKTPSLFIGGWPGIAAFGMMAGQQDYSVSAAHTLQTGGTEEQARKDGLTAAAWTLPTLVAYGVAGKVIGGAAGKLLPATATPLARAAIQLPANTFANMTASAALRVARGEDFIPENFIEHAAPDVLFALHGATDAYKNTAEIQRLRPTMEAMAAGTHPDAVLRKAIIDSPVFDDGAKKLAAAELAAFQRGAAEFLVNIGAKVPEDTGLIDRPGRGEAYQKMLDLAQERTALMRKMNDPAAPPPEGAVRRLAELHSEMRDLIEGPALSGKPAAAEQAGPKRAVQPEPTPEPPPAIAPQHVLAIHDAQADLDWAVGSGDAAEIEAARTALEAAKARAAAPAEPAQPAPPEGAPAPKGLGGGYDALVAETGFPAVPIARLAKESGIPLEDLKGQLTKLHAEGKVVLSVGDWSLADADTRAGALDVPGQPRNLQVRFLPEAAPEPAATPEPAAPAPAPAGKPKVRGGFRLPYAPNGTPDLIDFVMEQGGIRLPPKERRGQEYDDAPEFRGVYRRLLTTSGAIDADEMAQMMHENGLLRDGDVNAMWAELHKAAESRQRTRKQEAIQEARQREAGRAASRQEKAFDKDAGPESGEWPVDVDSLKIGDAVEVGGEKLKVTDIDPETGDVTLEDGKKYGIQIVGKDEVIYGEHVPAPRPAGDPFSGELVGGDATKTPEQLAAEQAEADAAALKLQQQQDARVGAAKPLRAGEDIRPERDMFGADAAEGDDLFDRKPSAPAAEPVPAAELPAAEPAPESAAPVETKPGATVERELTAEQQLALSKTAEGLANSFEWRNDAEKDSAIAEVQTKLEKGARTFLQGTGSLDGFSAAVVARSRFRDILKRAEVKKVSNPEPRPGEDGGGDTGGLPAWTDATAGEAATEADALADAATKKEAAAKIKDAMTRLSDKGESADDKRKILEGIANGDDHTTIADELGWTVGKDNRSDVTRVARALRRAVDEILSDTKLKREDVFGLLPPGMAQMMADIDTGIHFARGVWDSIVDLKPFNDFRRSLLNWSMTQQRSSNEVFNMLHFMERSVPRPAREGITNWIQAGGDRSTLELRRDASTSRDLRSGYQAALDLTPEQIRIAQHVSGVYDRLLQRGRAYGLLTNGLQDYVNQIWRQPNALAGILRMGSSRKLNEYFRFNQARVHESFFHGEQSGLIPVTKDISRLLAIYMSEMNNAIASRRLMIDLRRGRASDGRPLVSPNSRTSVIGDAGGRTVLVYPDRLPANIHDYKDLPDQPALHSWVWSSVDAAGNPTLVDADLVLHPEIHDHMRKVLSGSRLRSWWQSESRDPLQAIPKAAVKFMLEDVQSMAKQTMLGFFSPFHAVQEGTHAIFHRVNPFFGLPRVDLTRSAAQRDAAAHGLMLMPDRVSKAVFIEGLGATDKNLAVNIIRQFGLPGRFVARWADDFQHWLFHSYIPALKYKTYEHILERNRERYRDEFASGEASDPQVKYLSAQQANAAYGHLNYADMGRSANWMHLSSSLLLAPDFLEARGRFTAQAIKGALGAKSGREQLTAMMFGAAGLWMGARILNKIGDDDWHWGEGFDIIHGNRRYTIRSVPEDIVHAITDTRKFVMGRVSPVVKLGIESSTGRNYRGEKVEGWEPFRDFVASIVPLTVQPFTRGMSDTTKNNPVTRGEQLMGALGLHVARYSPITSIYPLANDWRKENAGKITGVTKPDNTSYPVSKYQQLRYALDDGDYERAAREFAKLQQAEGATVKVPAWKIRDGFKESLHHPFTGTEKTDRKFRDSLQGKERQIYDAATARRHLIWDRFVKMRQASAQKSPAP